MADGDAHDDTCPVEAVTTGGYQVCTRLIGHSGPHSWPYPEPPEAGHG